MATEPGAGQFLHPDTGFSVKKYGAGSRGKYTFTDQTNSEVFEAISNVEIALNTDTASSTQRAGRVQVYRVIGDESAAQSVVLPNSTLDGTDTYTVAGGGNKYYIYVSADPAGFTAQVTLTGLP